MTNNPTPDNNTPPRTEPDWLQAFDQLEQFGINVAQWLNQLGIGADADLQQATLSEPIGTCGRAQIRLDLTVGKASIRALPAGNPNLIEANVVSIGAVEMAATTEGDAKTVRLRQKRNTDDLFKPVKDAVDTVARLDQLVWDVRLSPDVPLMLTINAGLTIDDFDFNGLQLPRLTTDGGTGRTVVRLASGASNATIAGGVGILDLYVPDGAKLTLALDAGAGATNVFVGEASVKATVDGGVGNFTVFTSPDAAVRVMADSGLGNISVPPNVKPVEFESEFISESGLWETAGFEFAPHKVDIRYEGGVGSLIVQHSSADDDDAATD